MIRDKFQPVVFKAMAVKIKRSGMISGTKAWRAGIDSARIVPLKNPNQIKSQNVTLPLKMITAMTTVAAQLRACARRFGRRSANTPPYKEKITDGSMKDNVTQAKSKADEVSAYTNQPRAMICMFIAKDEPKLPIHSQRKFGTANAEKMSFEATY